MREEGIHSHCGKTVWSRSSSLPKEVLVLLPRIWTNYHILQMGLDWVWVLDLIISWIMSEEGNWRECSLTKKRLGVIWPWPKMADHVRGWSREGVDCLLGHPKRINPSNLQLAVTSVSEDTPLSSGLCGHYK